MTLKPFADYSNTVITIASLISLFVCLIPTTIGGLLSAIGIAGMDRALRANVITKSGKAVETAGDIDTLLLDKTGTITIGNRKATHFHTAPGVDLHDFVETCLLSSLSDETPEGKSIVELGRESGIRMRSLNTTGGFLHSTNDLFQVAGMCSVGWELLRLQVLSKRSVFFCHH